MSLMERKIIEKLFIESMMGGVSKYIQEALSKASM